MRCLTFLILHYFHQKVKNADHSGLTYRILYFPSIQKNLEVSITSLIFVIHSSKSFFLSISLSGLRIILFCKTLNRVIAVM